MCGRVACACVRGLVCALAVSDSLLPIVFLAALSIPFEMRGVAGAVCIPVAVLWCANAASLFFVAALNADDAQIRSTTTHAQQQQPPVQDADARRRADRRADLAQAGPER